MESHMHILCLYRTQAEGGGRPSASVTFGKYGFTLTERKLSPHEQKLWPLAIRRGGGRWVTVWGRWLISASLVWLRKLLLRLGPFVILLYYRTLAAKQFLIPAVTLGKAQNLRNSQRHLFHICSIWRVCGDKLDLFSHST